MRGPQWASHQLGKQIVALDASTDSTFLKNHPFLCLYLSFYYCCGLWLLDLKDLSIPKCCRTQETNGRWVIVTHNCLKRNMLVFKVSRQLFERLWAGKRVTHVLTVRFNGFIKGLFLGIISSVWPFNKSDTVTIHYVTFYLKATNTKEQYIGTCLHTIHTGKTSLYQSFFCFVFSFFKGKSLGHNQ